MARRVCSKLAGGELAAQPDLRSLFAQFLLQAGHLRRPFSLPMGHSATYVLATRNCGRLLALFTTKPTVVQKLRSDSFRPPLAARLGSFSRAQTRTGFINISQKSMSRFRPNVHRVQRRALWVSVRASQVGGRVRHTLWAKCRPSQSDQSAPPSQLAKGPRLLKRANCSHAD